MGPIIGPMLGGWLTEDYNWRWVFYINLPVGMLCLRSASWCSSARPGNVREPFDFFGFAS
jgi:DHA2 family multidrug resistance protein